jgi:thiopeptide-type bacteriocin biosynthesis protein
MPASATGGWLSAHLHLDGDLYAEAADRVILEVVSPVAAECLRRRWARRFFFVRYGEGGPHVRFRLLAREDGLEPRLRRLLDGRTAGGTVREIAWVPYEPEQERYGGPAGVAVAERFFDASSRAAVAALRKLSPGDRPARLGKALLALLAGLHAFGLERAAAAAQIRTYGESYLRHLAPTADFHGRLSGSFERGLEKQAGTLAAYVEAAWEALEAGTGLPPEMARYRRRLGEAWRRLASPAPGTRRGSEAAPAAGDAALWGSIVPSYLHMTSNRLGATVQEEAYLAVVAGATLAGAARATA